jgi:8-oxo-dGTP pyrophosphatase MutT (NUDIX family)
MRQAAALPYRHVDRSGGSIDVLLVTSSSGRWIIPKGDIDDGMAPHQAAEQEAFEEGGVRGRIEQRPIGTFRTCKQQDGADSTVEVEVFPLEVSEELNRWPEMSVRQRRWLPLREGAETVADPGLAAILNSFRA